MFRRWLILRPTQRDRTEEHADTTPAVKNMLHVSLVKNRVSRCAHSPADPSDGTERPASKLFAAPLLCLNRPAHEFGRDQILGQDRKTLQMGESPSIRESTKSVEASSLLLPPGVTRSGFPKSEPRLYCLHCNALIFRKLIPVAATRLCTKMEEFSSGVRLTTARVDNTHKKGLKHPNTPGRVRSYTGV